MASDGQWGDQLTLRAVAELLRRPVVIISSVAGAQFVTEFTPAEPSGDPPLLLCHWAEWHYGSLIADSPSSGALCSFIEQYPPERR